MIRAISTAGVALLAAVLALFGYLPVVNFFLLTAFAFGLWRLRQERHTGVKAWLVWVATVTLGFIAAVYRPEGFDYPMVWQGHLFPGGEPFALWVNLSKALGGYLILLWLLPRPTHWGRGRLIHNLGAIGLAMASVFFVAHWLFKVPWQPKLPAATGYFIAINLCVTVVAEAAFFRLLIQAKLSQLLRPLPGAGWITVALVTALFALAHMDPSHPFFLLYALAGLAYALVYQMTRSISACVAAHFGVNLLHFLLLEYPLAL